MRGIHAEVKGIPELQQGLREMAVALSDDEAIRIYAEAARALRQSVKTYTPRGKHETYVGKGQRKEPGRLRRAIIAQAFSKTTTKRYGPGAYVLVALGNKRRETAPYGHIVESGRRGHSIDKPVKFIGRRGKWVTKMWGLAGFTGRYYFRRAIQSAGPSELGRAERALVKILEKIALRTAAKSKTTA